MSDTPKTDALREVIVGQYKEDELTGNGMGNILAALTDIETLERERECECKCDVDWPEEYYELRQRLERERDAERAIAEQRGRLYDTAIRQLKALERDLDRLEAQLAAERALADRLADYLNNLWHHHSLTEASYDYIDNALTAWKEARSE